MNGLTLFKLLEVMERMTEPRLRLDKLKEIFNATDKP